MGTLDLSSNFLEGSVSTAFLRSMPRLYQLDLSWLPGAQQQDFGECLALNSVEESGLERLSASRATDRDQRALRQLELISLSLSLSLSRRLERVRGLGALDPGIVRELEARGSEPQLVRRRARVARRPIGAI